MQSIDMEFHTDRHDSDFVLSWIWDFPSAFGKLESVRSIQLSEPPTSTSRVSSWAVPFRNEEFLWDERDELIWEQRAIEFVAGGGDFDVFEGKWMIADQEGGALVRFAMKFDMGVPSLSGMIEPLAAQLIKNIVTECMAVIGGSEKRSNLS